MKGKNSFSVFRLFAAKNNYPSADNQYSLTVLAVLSKFTSLSKTMKTNVLLSTTMGLATCSRGHFTLAPILLILAKQVLHVRSPVCIMDNLTVSIAYSFFLFRYRLFQYSLHC
jgi:hypothetical protein